MKAILFDLDGTLLPMDMERFMHIYFHQLGAVVIPLGVPKEKFTEAIWLGTKAMMKNTSDKLNMDVFWEVFSAHTGTNRKDIEPVCDTFYSDGFQAARAATMENPLAAEAVRIAHEKADKVVLATNPLFPMQGQITRMSWLGLKPEDFDLVTCYSSDRRCKPNPAYFQEVCQRIGVEPKDCLMIGNDEREDMLCASSLGIECYLVTDCIIPCPEHPWQGKKGTFAEMVEMLKSL